MSADSGPTNGPLNDTALGIAAKESGLRPDQVRRAVEMYRAACAAVEDEPEWQAVTHVSGSGIGLHLYEAGGTGVRLRVETSGKVQSSDYVLGKLRFPTYAEARAVELADRARPGPYEST